MKGDFYSALNVHNNASQAEIKRAYFQAVRKHPPETDPSGFKLIRCAYETLYDPKARKEYDALQSHGDEITRLSSLAKEKMNDSNWNWAATYWKRVLMLFPESEAAWNGLGLCYLNVEKWEHAVKTYQKLVGISPDTAVYWLNLGAAFAGQADKDSVNAPRLNKAARNQFRKAIQIYTTLSQAYIAIAQTYLDEEKYDSAENSIEEAIYADSKVDYSDFEAMFYLIIIEIRRNGLEATDKFNTIASRIEAIVPQDESIRSYVAYRFAALGHKCVEVKAYQMAYMFLKCAKRYSREEAIHSLCEFARKMYSAIMQYKQMANDDRVCDSLKRIVAFRMAIELDQVPENKTELINNIAEHMYHEKWKLVESKDILRSRYCELWAITHEAIEGLIDGNIKEANIANTVRDTASKLSCGCWIWIIIIVFSLIGAMIKSCSQ